MCLLSFVVQMRTITQRTNTINGRVYANDPTIFAWELCNECQCVFGIFQICLWPVFPRVFLHILACIAHLSVLWRIHEDAAASTSGHLGTDDYPVLLCSTTDNFEISRGQTAGTLLYNWQVSQTSCSDGLHSFIHSR